MTRNRELDCEDLRECTHQPEVAIAIDSRDPEFVIWRCRCGAFTWGRGCLEEKPKATDKEWK